MSISVSAIQFWLSSLGLSCHLPTFLDNGYDDLEICKKIGPGDLTAMGVTELQDRTRILAAVAELLVGGATQVYIRAAGCGWRVQEEEAGKSRQEIPANLLMQMLKMKMKTEGVNLVEYPFQNLGYLPLPLIYLSNRYSVSLSVNQREVEAVVEECWREELRKKSNIEPQDLYGNFSHKTFKDNSTPRFSTFQPPKQSSTLHPVPVCGHMSPQSSSDQPWGNILPSRQSGFLSSRYSDGSLSSSSLATASDYECPNFNWLNCSRLQDSGVSSSSSVDSLSCLLSTMRMRNTTKRKVRQQQDQGQHKSSRHLRSQFDKVKTHSRLSNVTTNYPAGHIYCVDGQLQPRLW